MATESEQVRILRESELLQVENKRLLLERDLARDQAASAAGDLERHARLTEQAQAQVTVLGDAITYVLHRRKNHGETFSCSTLEAVIAAPASEGDADGELKPEVEASPDASGRSRPLARTC